VGTRISRKASFAIAVALIVFITAVFRLVAMVNAIAIVNATTAGFAYLIAILIVAASWGIAESVVASIVATFCFNYFFLPPVGTWAIAEPENWVALFAFLVSALITSELSNRARRRTSEMERLYALGRSMLAMDTAQPIADQIAAELARICEIPSVTIYDRASDTVHPGGREPLLGIEAQLREVARSGSLYKNEKDGTTFAALSLAGRSSGSVAMRGAQLSNTALQALLNLVAITLENARSREILTRAQAARQSEEFKSTLLDGLAHEFKTPLTSIKAATTALLASNVSETAQRDELLTIIDQEAGRLSRLVSEATRVARIEAGKIQVNRQWHSVDTLIETVLGQMDKQRDGRGVDVSIMPDLPPVFVDANLLHLALRQLIDNALKYSPRRSAIRVAAGRRDGHVAIRVRNEGDPLSESERSRIFDKFYRGQNVRHQVAGTGMGLPVARDILVAHGGDVQLQNSDSRGTEFVIKIPINEI
jgi:two-component system, OmpR family, sensor histidine kinase KdpD